MEASKFVRSSSCKKGEPNLTVGDFWQWMSYKVTVCWDTARRWLQILGFFQRNHKKGVFFDGHERDDVIINRGMFLDKLLELDKRAVAPSLPLPELQPYQMAIKRVVHVFDCCCTPPTSTHREEHFLMTCTVH